MATVHLRITGKVQGVFFRASAAAVAAKLELNGWIRNTPDNAVEATVSGSEAAVEQFIDWCHTGPKNAQVSDVQVTPKTEDGLKGFQVIR